MKQLYPCVGVARLCGLFGKSRQAMYDADWRAIDSLMEEELILMMVKDIRKKLPKLGGVKLYKLLKGKITEQRIKLGRDAFFRLLRNNDLLVKKRKRYVLTTMSKHHFKKWPNLIDNLIICQSEELWVSDITYLRTENGFVYLFLITDAYSRKIMGYHLSQDLKVKGCIIALSKALKARQYPQRDLIHHSDRGIQYCCEQYVSLLLSNKIQVSMTQSGSPYDNAIAERVNGILKAELGLNKTFKNYSAAVDPLGQSIYAYNNLRPHMSCDYLTPEQAHTKQGTLTRKWKKKKYHVKLF
jgi:putative transposase